MKDDDELPDEPSGVLSGVSSRRRVAGGWLALLPLLLAYEWSLAAGGRATRNAAELCLTLPLRVAGLDQPIVRQALLAALGVGALLYAVHAATPLVAGLLVILEGFVAAFLLGPLLLLFLTALGDVAPAVALAGGPPRELPGLVRVGYHLGAGSFEELLFRVLAYGALFLLARRGALFLGAPDRLASWIGEGSGLAGSALCFAAFHLEVATRWLGPGGEPFDAGRFLWRLAAGLALGALFRLRGLGVAAWAHGVFNAALVLGAGPAVLR